MEANKNVLIVEDDPVQLRILTTAFLQAGYHPVIARSPAEAARKAGMERIDVILSDVQLEGGSAFDLLSELRRTGLGTPVILATAYATPDLHERAKEAGSARLIEKPCAITDIVDSVDQALKEWVSGRKAGRILLVEDHAPSRTVAAQLLGEAGFSTLPAESGRQALELMEASTAPVDVVVMDLTTPAPSGAELVKRIRALDPGVEIVMLAGDASRDEIVAAYAEGAAALLRKPYTEDQFLHFIRTQASLSRKRRAAAEREAKERASRPTTSRVRRIARSTFALARRPWIPTAGLMAAVLAAGILLMEALSPALVAHEAPPSVEQQMLREMRRFSDDYQKELRWYGITR